MSNVIKQLDTEKIRASILCYFKLFNIYVDVLSQKLNEETVGCSFNGTIITHLYHADDLALISPSSSNGMQKLITECESYAEVNGLKFN